EADAADVRDTTALDAADGAAGIPQAGVSAALIAQIFGQAAGRVLSERLAACPILQHLFATSPPGANKPWHTSTLGDVITSTRTRIAIRSTVIPATAPYANESPRNRRLTSCSFA